MRFNSKIPYLIIPSETVLMFQMVRHMDVSSSLVRVTVAATQSSDVYMFGALVYELFHEAPPFTDLHPHALIYNVGMGRRQPTAHLHCSTAIRVRWLICRNT